MPQFPDMVIDNQSNIGPNAIIKSSDNQNPINYTLYESQYEVLISQTRLKKRESSIEMENSKRIEETCRRRLKVSTTFAY